MKNIKSRELNSLKAVNGAMAVASVLALIALPAPAIAGAFKLDGIISPATAVPAFGGDMYTTTFEAGWFNGHNEDNYPDTTPPSQTTTVRYGKGTDFGEGSSTEYSWLFLEVPLYAKNMIWGESIFTADDIAEYGKDFDFGGATGSEKVIFGNSGEEVVLDLAAAYDKDGTPSGKDSVKENDSPWTIVDVRDSVDFLLGSGQCDTNTCEARNRTMSFEVKLAALSASEESSLFSAISSNQLNFHLSPDRVADVSEIPVPAAFWLFGTALIGFIGYSRRTRLG
jgi:hypothetical protein